MAIPYCGASGILGASVLGLAALSLGACASNDVYDPAPKFAQFEPQSEEIALTGSRIGRYESSIEQSRNSLSPTSVITQEDFDRYGETSIYRMLLRTMPNMVGPGGGRTINPTPSRPGGRP